MLVLICHLRAGLQGGLRTGEGGAVAAPPVLVSALYTVLYCTVLVSTLYTVLYCTVLYCTVLVSALDTVLYCTVLYCTVLVSALYTVLYCTVLYWCLPCTLYCTVLYCTVLYCTGVCPVYCTILYCTVLVSALHTVLYCTVLYCTGVYPAHCTVLYCTALYWCLPAHIHHYITCTKYFSGMLSPSCSSQSWLLAYMQRLEGGRWGRVSALHLHLFLVSLCPSPGPSRLRYRAMIPIISTPPLLTEDHPDVPGGVHIERLLLHVRLPGCVPHSLLHVFLQSKIKISQQTLKVFILKLT